MPSLTTARGNKREGVDYSAIWQIRVPRNLTHDGRGLYSYVGGGGSTQEDIGTLRTVQPLNLVGGQASFEVTIVDCGESNYIAVGVCNKAYAPNLLPGWEEVSIAFHTDEGSLFVSSDDEQPLQQPCKNGDVIKCALRPEREHPEKATVEFFRNEDKIASVTTIVPLGGFHGVVGMMSKGEKVQVSQPMTSKPVPFDQIWEVRTPQAVIASQDGVCSYVGPGDMTEDSIGTVRSKTSIDPLGPPQKRSFELCILHPGVHRYIAVGVCSEAYPKNMLPGWEDSSIGYHADNGDLFHSSGDGQPTDRPCKRGDVMKVTVDPVDGSPKEVCVIFQRNGQVVGQVTTWMPENGFYACFGMMSRNEKVQVVLPEVSVPVPREPMKFHFHDIWNIVTPNFQYHDNGICCYVGKGGSGHIGSIRSKLPLHPFGPDNSFEVKILDPGRTCSIALGVCAKDYPTNRLPGWEDISIGFHTDSGDILQSTVGEQSTSHPCRLGDVVKCTVEPVDGSGKRICVTFHRNGEFVAKTILWTLPDGLYAQIGAMGVGEVIQVATPQMEPSVLPVGVKVETAEARSATLPESPMQGKRFQQVEGIGGPQHLEGFIKEEPVSSYKHTSAGISSGHHVPQLSHPSIGRPPLPPYHHHLGYPPLHYYHDPPTSRGTVQQRESVESGWYWHHPGLQPSASTASPQAVYQRQPPLIPLPHTSVVGLTPSVYASQLSVMSAASEQEALHSQVSIESAEGFHSQGQLHHSKSESSFKAIHREPDRTLMHESSSFSTLPSTSTVSPLDFRVKTTYLPGVNEESEGEAVTPMVQREPNYRMLGADWMPAQSATSGTESSRQRQYGPFSPGQGKAYVHPFERTSSDVGPTGRQDDPVLPAIPGRRHGAVGGDFPDSPLNSVSGGIFLPMAEDSLLLPSQQAGAVHPQPFGDHQITERTAFHHVASPKSPSHAVPLHTSMSSIARVIPKTESRNFSILHNVVFNESGSLECSLPSHSTEVAFIMRRLPLTEKLSYFEVEVEQLHVASNGVSAVEGEPRYGNIAVGLVWNRYPPNQLPGHLQGSVAYHSLNGCLYTGAQECRELTSPCAVGDVIGCRAHLKYKMETLSHENSSTMDIEYFKNGCSIGRESTVLPASGFFPAVGLTGSGTTVKIRCDMMLTPENYFKAHPLPETYANFVQPPPSPATWRSIRNSKISDSNILSKERHNAGEPAVVQSYLPMTEVTPYFDVKLLYPLSAYTVIAIGIQPKIGPKSDKAIPGESPNSVGFFPRLSFVMRDGGISSTIPEYVTYPDQPSIGLGIDFNPQLPLPNSATSIDQKVKVFFTVNDQEVQSTIVTLPPSGSLHATVAIDSDSQEVSNRLVSLHFPNHRVSVDNLSYGFARGPKEPGTLEIIQPVWVRYADGTATESGDCVTHAMQAAYPLSRSHSYFEVCIIQGGDGCRISIGLAAFDYPMNAHPGSGKGSIAVHADSGHLFLNGDRTVVTAPSQHAGTVIGCGARFPDDGSLISAEVFFTLDRNIICKRFVSVPPLGFFPTIGLASVGASVMLNMTCPDPYPELCFSTSFGLLENVSAEGCVLQLISHALPGSAQLTPEVDLGQTNYFQISPVSELNGKVFVGYSSTNESPFTCKCAEDLKSYSLEITSGIVLIRDQYYQSTETCLSESGHQFGCGIKPLSGSSKSVLFFAVDYQVIYCTLVDLQNFQGKLFPYVYILASSTTRVSVDACSSWPPVTPIGVGWARFANLTRRNSQLIHSWTNQRPKTPIGFAQAAMPLTPSNPYFEVEVCSRAANKAIAVGLASRRYPSNTWVGWKNESIAYHLDDGRIFKGNGYGHAFGPKVYAGHTVGCGIWFTSTDHTTPCKGGEKYEVFFTLNGAIIHSQKASFSKVAPSGGFFPTVCLESQSESIIFHSHGQFPPVSSSVGTEWVHAYCIHQAGRVLEHSCRHKELTGGIPKAFCQAREPFSAEKPYFEVEITGMSSMSQISAGASKLLPTGSISASGVDSVMYSCAGQLVTRRGSQKMTSGTQKCVVGDKLGCALIFDGDQPTAIEFFLNNMKVLHLDGLLQRWRGEPLYPIIVLSHPGDAVAPSLGQLMPEWDQSMLIGWLRSERVKLRNNIVEYTGAPGTVAKIGIAQVSQLLHPETNPYFEVEILDPGIQCGIAIGVGAVDYPLSMLPGWGDNSIAYHGDDGKLYLGSPLGVCFGPTWKKQDTIGVGVRSTSVDDQPGAQVQIYFTRNGEELGHTTMTVPTCGLFPIIGLCNAHEKVKAQFSVPNSTNTACQVWGTLCGIKPSTSAVGSTQLTYWDNGRKTAPCGYKLASAFARQPFSESIQYFEMKILSFGAVKAIAIGVVPKNYSTEQVPGWLEDSIAYHSDSGHLHYHSALGKVFGPVGRKGDVFGCGVSFLPNNSRTCSVFFTYNGIEVGRVRSTIPEGGLYPAVCLTGREDKVSVTFHEAFKPRIPPSLVGFVGLMRINNCSYSNHIVSFTGSNGSSPAVAQFAVPLLTDRNYFAANIVQCGNRVLIGLAARDYPMKYAPGSTSISVAYDITNGTIRAIFSSEAFVNIEAPPCEVGDTVGCGIQEVGGSKTTRSHVFFTRNEQVVGTVELVEVFEELYPVVGMVQGQEQASAALFMNWNVPLFELQNVL